MKVIVIGGGFAGLAAAVALQERRYDVTLLERRGVLGGRATSFRDAATGDEVDNGTHVMVGAYRETLDLARRASALDLFAFQDDLRLDWVDEGRTASLDCPPLPAPLHLLGGLLGLRVPWRAKLQAIRFGLAARFGSAPEGLTVAEWFDRTGQGPEARRLFWDPLALAILNTAPERASALLFHRVYREAFLARRRASRLVFPRRGWAAVHERLEGYLVARGGHVRRGAKVVGIDVTAGRAHGVRTALRPSRREDVAAGVPATEEAIAADIIVCAVPWHAVGQLLPEGLRHERPFLQLARLGSAPIVSVDLWLDREIVDRPMVGLRGADMEWVFDKGRLCGRDGLPQHLSFIGSAAFRSAERPNGELVDAAVEALRRAFRPTGDWRVVRSLVLREPQATFSATPAAEDLRPGPRSPVAGLFLAGDWTATGLPATIEGAVRSGFAAARAVEGAVV